MKWYEIKNKADRAEIWLYELIGEDFWTGGGTTANEFRKELAEIKASQIDLHINSPGGDVFDGLAIYNLIKQHPAKVTTYIDGLAASIASVIAMAGDEIYMAENALFMIHKPYMLTVGNDDDHEKSKELLKTVGGSIAKSYASKTGKLEDELLEMMKVTTWFEADAAVSFGFVDEITEKIDMAACAKFVPVMVKAGFKNIPNAITEFGKKKPTAKDAEKALRDVGFSVKQAKTVVAKGISECLRDVDTVDDPDPQRDVVVADKVVEPVIGDRVVELLLRAETSNLTMQGDIA
jgi:ATP-dependent protease ClpP protease subunit